VRILFCGNCFPASHSLLKERLRAHGDEIAICDSATLRESLSHADVVIPMMTVLDAASMESGSFRLIQQWGSGLEGVDLAAARARGIWVANVPASGKNADSVAEHALLLTLALLRQLPAAQANVRAGILGAPLGRMLAGRTVCLWGLGATARALSGRLRALGARLLGISRDANSAKAAAFGLSACYSMDERAVCLAQTEILVLCVRLNTETRGLVDARALAMLPQGAYLVNAARGALIEYTALYDALSRGSLGGAALDVFWEEPVRTDDPLLLLPNVLATPHVAGVTEQSYIEIAESVAANIERLRRGEPPCNRAP
jgi:phosphoglycerate dehydrogenase-like enzyme